MDDNFTYCTRCGQKTFVNQQRKFTCSACGFQLFFNTASAVAVLIFRDSQVLFTVRARPPHQGKLDLPGGFVDFQESAEDALRREIREELNLTLADLSYFASFPNTYLYKQVEYQVLDLIYTCHARDWENCQPRDDVSDFLFLDPHELDLDRLAFVSSRNALRKLRRPPESNHTKPDSP